jgi:hypothetical protein
MKSSGFYGVIIISLVLISSSCSDAFWNCIDGNGQTSTVRRVVGDFTNVTSNGDFIVDVSIGSTTSVSIEADENLFSYIETYIQGNSLIIETEDNHCIQSREQIYVHVVTPSVYELKLTGSGVIYCDNVNAEELKYVLTGSGDIESAGITAGFIEANLTGSGEIILSGSAQSTDFLISGSGNIKSINMEQDKCIATISGSGTIYAFVNDLLDVLISGSGNVIYKGDPEKVINITGSGRVIKN